MPTNFLSDEQRKRFGHFTEDPDEGQLAGSLLLDQTARLRAMAARSVRNRIGWALQLGTLRYLGTFLENPEDVPAVVVGYVAEHAGSAAMREAAAREARLGPGLVQEGQVAGAVEEGLPDLLLRAVDEVRVDGGMEAG